VVDSCGAPLQDMIWTRVYTRQAARRLVPRYSSSNLMSPADDRLHLTSAILPSTAQNVRSLPPHKPAFRRPAMVPQPSQPQCLLHTLLRRNLPSSTPQPRIQTPEPQLTVLLCAKENPMAPLPPPEIPTARTPPKSRFHRRYARQRPRAPRSEHEESRALERGDADRGGDVGKG
jgi:hypothetical protein